MGILDQIKSLISIMRGLIIASFLALVAIAVAQRERCGLNPFVTNCVCRDSCDEELEEDDGLGFLQCTSGSCCCPSDFAPTCGIPILESCVCRRGPGCEDFEYSNELFGCDGGLSCCCESDEGSGEAEIKEE